MSRAMASPRWGRDCDLAGVVALDTDSAADCCAVGEMEAQPVNPASASSRAVKNEMRRYCNVELFAFSQCRLVRAVTLAAARPNGT
jgi:hypothetical protein